MSNSSKAYKHAVLAYKILINDDEDMTLYVSHLALLDVVDILIDEKMTTVATRHLDDLGYSLVKKMALFVIKTLSDHHIDSVVAIGGTLQTEFDFVERFPDLCRNQAQSMLMSSINKALASTNEVANTSYPDLELLK